MISCWLLQLLRNKTFDINRNLIYNTEYFLTNKILSDIFLLALITNKLWLDQKAVFYWLQMCFWLG